MSKIISRFLSALPTSRHNLMEHATFSLQKPKIWNAKSDWSPEILVNARQPIRSGVILTLSLLERPKPALVILLCLAPDNFTCQGRASGGKGLTGSICPSLFLNPFSPRLAKTVPFVSLLCLMPDKFTCQVNWTYLPISLP